MRRLFLILFFFLFSIHNSNADSDLKNFISKYFHETSINLDCLTADNETIYDPQYFDNFRKKLNPLANYIKDASQNNPRVLSFQIIMQIIYSLRICKGNPNVNESIVDDCAQELMNIWKPPSILLALISKEFSKENLFLLINDFIGRNG